MKSVRNIFALYAAFYRFFIRAFILVLCIMNFAMLTLSIVQASVPSGKQEQNSNELLQPNPLIRIGLTRFLSCPSVVLRALPGARLFAPNGEEKASGIGPWTISATPAGSSLYDSRGIEIATIAAGERWRFQAENPDTLLGISLSGGSVHHYRGALEICSKALQLCVINEITLESYLRGVVPAEMGGSSPIEALKAQAVASRTYAMYSLAQNAHSIPQVPSRKIRHAAFVDTRPPLDYDLRDDTQAQVYDGADRNSKSSDIAIQQTAGWILTQGGKPIPAFFSSSCGGVTCPGSSADSCPHSVDDSEAHGGSSSHVPDWTLTYTPEKLAAAFAKNTTFRGHARVSSFTVIEKDISGRVKRINIQWDSARMPGEAIAPPRQETLNPEFSLPDDAPGTDTPSPNKNTPPDTLPNQKSASQTEISGNTLRALLGNDTLRSTLFEVRRGLSGEFIIEGRGWGHGKGLCQVGAMSLASLPGLKDYRTILMHYYEGADLTHIVYSDEDSILDKVSRSDPNSREVAP